MPCLLHSTGATAKKGRQLRLFGVLAAGLVMEHSILYRGAPAEVIGAVAGAKDGDVVVTFLHDGVAVCSADTTVGAATYSLHIIP